MFEASYYRTKDKQTFMHGAFKRHYVQFLHLPAVTFLDNAKENAKESYCSVSKLCSLCHHSSPVLLSYSGQKMHIILRTFKKAVMNLMENVTLVRSVIFELEMKVFYILPCELIQIMKRNCLEDSFTARKHKFVLK